MPAESRKKIFTEAIIVYLVASDVLNLTEFVLSGSVFPIFTVFTAWGSLFLKVIAL